MAEELPKKGDPKVPPLPAFLSKPQAQAPKLPLPPLPGLGSASAPQAQAPQPPMMAQAPWATGYPQAPAGVPYMYAPQMPVYMAPAPQVQAAPGAPYAPGTEGLRSTTSPSAPPPPPDADRRIVELEKKLQQEREKVLMASLKAQEEKTVAARVETSIKEIQDKLRRDRRDAEQEESRLKLEARIQELEARLVQERETWVTTLKGQMQGREVADKEIEGHFTSRIQEMERRWLEEKAHWQRIVSAKDEELRKARVQLERLVVVEPELQKATSNAKLLEERLAEISKSHALLQAKATAAAEREGEFHRLRAEADRATEGLRVSQDRFERDIEAVRSAARDREQRLAADNERLQNELATITSRVRGEYEGEIRRIRVEYETDIKKARAQADLATAALQRLRAVAGALEKQVASMRMQAEEAKKLKEEVQRVNDRYKAEFLVLQRRWQDREAEIRKEAEGRSAAELAKAKAESERLMEAERTKIKLRAQEEIQQRVLKAEEGLRRELEGALLSRERAIRAEMERELGERSRKVQAEVGEVRKSLEAELDRRGTEAGKRDAEWQERLVKKEAELVAARAALDEARGRLAQTEEWKAESAREKLYLEKTSARLAERVRAVEAETGALKAKLAAEERRTRELELQGEAAARARSSAEEKTIEAEKRLLAAETQSGSAEKARKSAEDEKLALREQMAKVEAEYGRQMETFRRKLDLTRRDLEARFQEAQSERDAALRQLAEERRKEPPSLFERLFGGKRKQHQAAPEPPPQPPVPPTEGA
ncbi:MAG: hypothetical protein WC728_02810 [Elusimicrobiota bacterium]